MIVALEVDPGRVAGTSNLRGLDPVFPFIPTNGDAFIVGYWVGWFRLALSI